MLPSIAQLMTTEPYATIQDPPAWIITCFMLAPCFGITAVVLFVVARARRTQLGLPPRPDQPTQPVHAQGRDVHAAEWGLALALGSAAIWVFFVLESLSQSGAP
jgi:hypothetical protein